MTLSKNQIITNAKEWLGCRRSPTKEFVIIKNLLSLVEGQNITTNGLDPRGLEAAIDKYWELESPDKSLDIYQIIQAYLAAKQSAINPTGKL